MSNSVFTTATSKPTATGGYSSLSTTALSMKTPAELNALAAKTGTVPKTDADLKKATDKQFKLAVDAESGGIGAPSESVLADGTKVLSVIEATKEKIFPKSKDGGTDVENSVLTKPLTSLGLGGFVQEFNMGHKDLLNKARSLAAAFNCEGKDLGTDTIQLLDGLTLVDKIGEWINFLDNLSPNRHSNELDLFGAIDALLGAVINLLDPAILAGLIDCIISNFGSIVGDWLPTIGIGAETGIPKMVEALIGLLPAIYAISEDDGVDILQALGINIMPGGAHITDYKNICALLDIEEEKPITGTVIIISGDTVVIYDSNMVSDMSQNGGDLVDALSNSEGLDRLSSGTVNATAEGATSATKELLGEVVKVVNGKPVFEDPTNDTGTFRIVDGKVIPVRNKTNNQAIQDAIGVNPKGNTTGTIKVLHSKGATGYTDTPSQTGNRNVVSIPGNKFISVAKEHSTIQAQTALPKTDGIITEVDVDLTTTKFTLSGMRHVSDGPDTSLGRFRKDSSGIKLPNHIYGKPKWLILTS